MLEIDPFLRHMHVADRCSREVVGRPMAARPLEVEGRRIPDRQASTQESMRASERPGGALRAGLARWRCD